jgi:ferredoxin
MMQTAHGATRPLDRPAIEYPTCATILDPLHQVSYSCHDFCRCTSCRTYHLHTMKQANVILEMKQK